MAPMAMFVEVGVTVPKEIEAAAAAELDAVERGCAGATRDLEEARQQPPAAPDLVRLDVLLREPFAQEDRLVPHESGRVVPRAAAGEDEVVQAGEELERCAPLDVV